MTQTYLKASYDSGFSTAVKVYNVTATGYCLSSPGQGTTIWYYAGPGGTVTKTQPTTC
jgi:hypothetical protein